ncbi:hypothetical protein [Tsukamurella ocularis]|uniref:hypothetical protein n=1 Tax=Tsukamurella ocularis TaxID=1970234 RepID=UPI002169FD15|nr:hypothetical protein [Tsukamurella ocularis]MCS3781324.1 hypothetical protein [Tsukamurella ocularis]MCS3787695.1 hypothetical protein [Tsukamurella ocularis]MCS3850990.1 hypothetical protein [Tsukamurella ocularis]
MSSVTQSTVVVRAPDVRIPGSLRDLETITVDLDSAKAELKQKLTFPKRIVVAGPDDLLAAVIARLMASERLDVEVAYVPTENSHASSIYPPGDPLTGTPRAVPLIRDDRGFVLVGKAKITGPDGGPLIGETFVDSEKLFTGQAKAVIVEPFGAAGETGGVRARLAKGVRRRWLSGRAAQTGGLELVVTRDGRTDASVVTRATFYRNTEDWLLIS